LLFCGRENQKLTKREVSIRVIQVFDRYKQGRKQKKVLGFYVWAPEARRVENEDRGRKSTEKVKIMGRDSESRVAFSTS